jgi:hypothetical protein
MIRGLWDKNREKIDSVFLVDGINGKSGVFLTDLA